MKTDEQKAAEDKYNAWLKELDAGAEEFVAERKAEYASDRDDFSGVLSAWGDKAEAEWDEFKAEVEQKWHSLRQKWHAATDDAEDKAEEVKEELEN